MEDNIEVGIWEDVLNENQRYSTYIKIEGGNGVKQDCQHVPGRILQGDAAAPRAKAGSHQFLPEHQSDDLHRLHLQGTQGHRRKDRVLRLRKHQLRQHELRRPGRTHPRQHIGLRSRLPLHGWILTVPICPNLQYLPQRLRRILHPQRHLLHHPMIPTPSYSIHPIHNLAPDAGQFSIIMSSTPVEYLGRQQLYSPSESPSCQRCPPSQLQNQSSSEDSSGSQSSRSIQINVYAKNTEASVMRFEQLQKEIKELQNQNRLLARKNKELMGFLMPARDSQKQLKRALKEKELEILQLKNQISVNSYGMSSVSIQSPNGLGARSKIRYETSRDKPKTKSHRKCHRKQQSSDSSSSQQFGLNDNALIRRQWEAQRQLLERQLSELQQKVLEYESQARWTSSLAMKVINLGNKLGFLFKEKVSSSEWSVKRQAKAAWRYLKHILGYMLLIQ